MLTLHWFSFHACSLKVTLRRFAYKLTCTLSVITWMLVVLIASKTGWMHWLIEGKVSNHPASGAVGRWLTR